MNKKGHKRSRGDEQLQLVHELEELWMQMPSLRFMQFIEIIVQHKGSSSAVLPFYMGDIEFLQRLRNLSGTKFTDNYYEKNPDIH